MSKLNRGRRVIPQVFRHTLSAMSRVLATLALILATGVAVAIAPPAPVDGPPAEVRVDRYGAQHTIYVRLPLASASYSPAKIVAQLHSTGPSKFSAQLSGERLPDGRLQFIVFLDPSLESEYYLTVFDQGTPRWHVLYFGNLQSMARF